MLLCCVQVSRLCSVIGGILILDNLSVESRFAIAKDIIELQDTDNSQ